MGQQDRSDRFSLPNAHHGGGHVKTPAQQLSAECPQGFDTLSHEMGHLRHYRVFGQLVCLKFQQLCTQALPFGSCPSLAQRQADDAVNAVRERAWRE